MRTGITSLADVLVGVWAVLTAAIICAGAAGAEPSQEDQFLAVLQQEQIPAIDNVPGLVYHAHEICGQLDGGASVDTVVNNVVDKAYAENPGLQSLAARARRTAVKFVIASVDVYCPSHQGQLPPPP